MLLGAALLLSFIAGISSRPALAFAGGNVARVERPALAGRKLLADQKRSYRRGPSKDRLDVLRRSHRAPSDEKVHPSRRHLRSFIAACAAATVGMRARSMRSRLRRAGTASAVVEQPVHGGRKPFFRLFAPIAFKQWTNLPTELGAGVTTAVVALPLAMAFGVTSGAGPLAGLYGAIFTGFLAALFGGTPAQVTGPTGPMAVIMATVIAKCPDMSLAFWVVTMAGVMQIAMGVLKLGGVIRLVPRTVLSGFMTGIGGIICSLQMPVILGHTGSGQVISALGKLPAAAANPNGPAFGIGLFTLFMLYTFPARLTFNVPRPLLALVAASIADAVLFQCFGISVPSLGAIPQGLPSITLDWVAPSVLVGLAPLALTLAILGAVDSLLTSLVADSMTSSFHDSDRELVGQGIGNAVAGLMGGHAGAGATMRTVVNVRTGGRTPISGATHSLVLLGAVLGLGSLARYVPLSCLAAILIKSGLDVVDWALIKRIRGLPRGEVAILLVTFLTTVFVDLIVAVVAGWALAILLFFFKAAKLQLGRDGVQVFDSSNASQAPGEIRDALEAAEPGTTSVVQLKGQVTFGAAVGLLRQLVPKVVGKEVVVVDLGSVTMIDASAILCLEELNEKVAAENGRAYVCGARRDIDGIELLRSLDLARSASNESVEDQLTSDLLAA